VVDDNVYSKLLKMGIFVHITEQELNIRECISMVAKDDCGGIATFIGTVRNHTLGKDVLKLEFEAADTMAVKEMEKIALQAYEQFAIQHVLIYHRTGVLQIGEIPVIIAVAAHHRKAAFEACQFAIDTLKETVPIWKKEFFADGAVWVSVHP